MEQEKEPDYIKNMLGELVKHYDVDISVLENAEDYIRNRIEYAEALKLYNLNTAGKIGIQIKCVDGSTYTIDNKCILDKELKKDINIAYMRKANHSTKYVDFETVCLSEYGREYVVCKKSKEGNTMNVVYTDIQKEAGTYIMRHEYTRLIFDILSGKRMFKTTDMYDNKQGAFHTADLMKAILLNWDRAYTVEALKGKKIDEYEILESFIKISVKNYTRDISITDKQKDIYNMTKGKFYENDLFYYWGVMGYEFPRALALSILERERYFEADHRYSEYRHNIGKGLEAAFYNYVLMMARNNDKEYEISEADIDEKIGRLFLYE